MFDTYVSYAPTSALSFGIDANYVTNEVNKADPELALQGVGAYARYQLNGPAAFAVRYERLDDEGLFGGIDQVLQEVTAGLEYKFADGFLLRGEFRRDWSNELFFTTSAAPGEAEARWRSPCARPRDRWSDAAAGRASPGRCGSPLPCG